MTYQIRNSDLRILIQRFKTEASAITRATEVMNSDICPLFITEDNGEIVALVYCGVVYRPEPES